MLVVTMHLDVGGAEQLVVTTTNWLAAAGEDVTVAALLRDRLPLRQVLGQQVEFVSLGATVPWDLRWCWRLAGLVRRTRPHVVHIHSPFAAALTRPIVRGAAPKAKLVTTFHNSSTTLRRLTRRLTTATMTMDDHTFAVSEDTAASIRSSGHAVEALVHGIDVAATQECVASRRSARAGLAVHSETVVVTNVANLRPTKDHETLLLACAELRDEDVLVLLVGDGELRHDIERLHRQLDLGDRVRILGRRTDVPSLLAASDIFCLSSWMEGYPVALMEAFALELPIVATAVGGIRDAVRDGIEGVLVPARDPVALAGALRRLMRDPRLRATMSAASRARASDYDIGRAASRYQQVYRQLLGMASTVGEAHAGIR